MPVSNLRPAPPIEAPFPAANEELQALVDVVPIAAAIIDDRPGGALITCCNAAFRAAGAARSDRSIVAEAEAFLASDQCRRETHWETGAIVDRRFYRVVFSRHGRSSRCLVALLDQTTEFATTRSLRREMLTDSLTGLPNRAGFGERIEALLADPEQRHRHAVLVLDFDRFSRVNACLGTLVGDELLMTFARRVKGALRAQDVLARTGGDEFGVLVHCDAASDVDHVAQRIAKALAVPFRLSELEIRLSCAIGIARGDGIDDAELLIRHAQFAVKRSKKTGRPEVYQDSAFDMAREAFGTETLLRRALENGELRLAYQPIVELATGRPVAFEALARWTLPDGSVQRPDVFIPIAEESGLIVPLGRWAIETAVCTLAQWDERTGGDCGMRFSVNLSAIQLQRDDIAAVVADSLARHKLCGTRLCLELTESALVTDPDGVIRVMSALRDLGTTVAMDDFGTGYSNLAYLQKLPIDVLKIDRRFVADMQGDRDKVAIVRTILGLAHTLGVGTTAEGVESDALAHTLSALGCKYGQGFTFAKALEADAAYAWFTSRSA